MKSDRPPSSDEPTAHLRMILDETAWAENRGHAFVPTEREWKLASTFIATGFLRRSRRHGQPAVRLTERGRLAIKAAGLNRRARVRPTLRVLEGGREASWFDGCRDGNRDWRVYLGERCVKWIQGRRVHAP